MRTCEFCGNVIQGNQGVCQHCGKQVEARQVTIPSSVTEQQNIVTQPEMVVDQETAKRSKPNILIGAIYFIMDDLFGFVPIQLRFLLVVFGFLLWAVTLFAIGGSLPDSNAFLRDPIPLTISFVQTLLTTNLPVVGGSVIFFCVGIIGLVWCFRGLRTAKKS